MVRFFRVGIVASVHGLKGEVKVYPTGDDPERFRLYEEVMLARENEPEENWKSYRVEQVKSSNKLMILKLQGVSTPEEARLLLKKEIYVPREMGVPLEEGEYYVADLIGCRVLDEQGEELGMLKDVLRTGANDVYVCGTPSGKEMLLPVIPDCVLEKKPEEGFVRVKLMPGLKELYL